MWSLKESGCLINSVELHVMKLYPGKSKNKNHEFAGNLNDIVQDWSEIAIKLKRSGKLSLYFLMM